MMHQSFQNRTKDLPPCNCLLSLAHHTRTSLLLAHWSALCWCHFTGTASQFTVKFEPVDLPVPTLPREIVPPQKTGILPRRTISRQGGTISRESRGQPLLSLLHTKTATPLQYEKLSPLFAVRDIVPPSLFPPGGTISRGRVGK